MCHSRASTAVCMSTRDPRSVVVVPRTRRHHHDKSVFFDDTRLINYAKYSKLVESRRSNSAPHNKCVSVSVPNNKQRSQDHDDQQNIEPKEVQKTPNDTVFQVRLGLQFLLHQVRYANDILPGLHSYFRFSYTFIEFHNLEVSRFFTCFSLDHVPCSVQNVG